MSQITLRLYGTPGSTGITSNMANVIVPRTGRIVGLLLNKMLVPPSGSDNDLMQVSLVSVQQFTVNDAQGVIADLVTYMNFDAADHWNVTPSQMVSPINVSVVSGQKVYLHVDAAVSSNAYFALLYVEI